MVIITFSRSYANYKWFPTFLTTTAHSKNSIIRRCNHLVTGAISIRTIAPPITIPTTSETFNLDSFNIFPWRSTSNPQSHLLLTVIKPRSLKRLATANSFKTAKCTVCTYTEKKAKKEAQQHFYSARAIRSHERQTSSSGATAGCISL